MHTEEKFFTPLLLINCSDLWELAPVAVATLHLLPNLSNILRMLKDKPFWLHRKRHFLRFSLPYNCMAGNTLVGNHLPIGTFVKSIVAAIATGEI